MRTRCETLLQTAQNTISRDFTLRFAELESTLCRVLTDVIRPIEQQVKMELSESGFRPGFHFPVFHGVVPTSTPASCSVKSFRARQQRMSRSPVLALCVRFFALVESA